MLEKPCGRPTCTTPIRKATPSRLAAAVYCSRICGAQHRLERGDHPFLCRTQEEIVRNARKAGRTRGERAKRRTMLSVAAKIDKWIPKDWHLRFDARDLARIKAIGVRLYHEGKDDGYQAGYTIQYRQKVSA